MHLLGKESMGMGFTLATSFYVCFLEAKPAVSQTPLAGKKKGNKIIHFTIKFPANYVNWRSPYIYIVFYKFESGSWLHILSAYII
jgi:hypothetical protein